MQAISSQGMLPATCVPARGAVAAPPAADANPDEKAWTLLFYNVGHADESKMCTASLLDLQRVGSDENTHVVVMNYRSPWFPEKLLRINQEHNGARTYEVGTGVPPVEDTKAEPGTLAADVDAHVADGRALLRFGLSAPKHITAVEIERHPADSNPGDPDMLRRFLAENVQRYPARHYALFISGHGAGFAGQAIVHNPEGRIRNEQLAATIEDVTRETGKKVDLVNLNTCFGANVETLYPLRNAADAAVASQGTIFAGTQPFGRVLADIQQAAKEGTELSGADVARLCVEEARRQPLGNVYTETLTAVDLKQVDALATSLDRLYGTLVDQQVPPAVIREAWEKAHRMDYSAAPRQIYVTDVGSFAEEISGQTDNEHVRTAANDVKSALAAAVLAETHPDPLRETLPSLALRTALFKKLHENPELSGVTAYLDDEPDGPNGRLEQIQKSEFGQKTRAAEFLAYMARDKTPQSASLLGRLHQHHTVLAQKVGKITHIPGALAIAERVGVAAAMLTTFHALSAVGIPAYPYAFGTYFLARGAASVVEGFTAERPAESLPRRKALIDAAARVSLGAATATFGLYLLGVLPPVVAWPAAIVAGGVRVGTEIAKLLAATPERRKILQDDAAFAAAPVSQKLNTESTQTKRTKIPEEEEPIP